MSKQGQGLWRDYAYKQAAEAERLRILLKEVSVMASKSALVDWDRCIHGEDASAEFSAIRATILAGLSPKESE
jgi:hypothetical protein